MMLRRWTPLLLSGLWAVVGCGNDMTAPEPAVLTILAHYQQTGENLLINSDGHAVGSLGPETVNMVPIGAYAANGTIVLLTDDGIAVTTLSHPEAIDTVIRPRPATMSLVSFAPGGASFAFVSYTPVPAVFLYERANHKVDTLSMGGANPALPPVFSPDGQRIALITVTELSMQVTLLEPGSPSQPSTATFRVSRILNRPVFGWPRWTDDGILMAFRRVAQDGPDTLLVGIVHPDDPDFPLEERYRAVMAPADQQPEIVFGPSSTYALSESGDAVVVAAFASVRTNAHSLYLVRPDLTRIQIVEDDPAAQLSFAQFVND